MTGIVFRALRLLLLVSLAAGVVLMVTDGLGEVLLESYLLAVGAILLVAFVRTIRLELPSGLPSHFDSALAAMRRAPAEAEEPPLVHELRLSRLSAFHLHVRLRPLLSEIAAHRLWTHYGVELAAEPARANELVGPAAWEVVRPDRAPPTDRLARGLPLSGLRRIMTDLEHL